VNKQTPRSKEVVGEEDRGGFLRDDPSGGDEAGKVKRYRCVVVVREKTRPKSGGWESKCRR
jgi:hypothetical protein